MAELSLAELLQAEPNWRRKMQSRALAGLEPTDEQSAAYAAGEGERQARTENLADVGVIAGTSLVPAAKLAQVLMAMPRTAAAGAAAIGLAGGSAEPNAGEGSDLAELRKSLADVGSPELERIAREKDLALKQVDQALGQQATGSKQMAEQNAKLAPLNQRVTDLTTAYNKERERIQTEANQRAESVMSARSEATQARDRERAKAPKPFTQWYEEDLRKEMPLMPPPWALPMAAGALGAGASKLMSVPSSWIGRVQAEMALRGKDMERAGELAAKHAPGGLGAYLKDAITGGVSGLTLGTVPLAADAVMQPARNPEKDAQRAYTSELLDIDPKKAAAVKRMESMPDSNPALDKTKDLGNWARGMGAGFLEGASMGKLTGTVMDAAKPKFANVKAAVDAAAKSGNGGGGNGGGQGGNQQGPLKDYGKYPDVGHPDREAIRSGYRQSVLDAGEPLQPSSVSKIIQKEAENEGFKFPSTTGRVKETNKNIRSFQEQEGRLPISNEEWNKNVFKDKGTLAVPATAGGAAAAASLSPDEAKAASEKTVMRMLNGQDLGSVTAADIAASTGMSEDKAQQALDGIRSRAGGGTRIEQVRRIKDHTSPTGHRHPDGRFAPAP